MMTSGALCLVGLLGACGSFSGADTPSDGDAGIARVDSAGSPPPPDAGLDAPTTFCGEHASALFCDDFEADDLAMRWPLQELDLGVVDVVDGASVGRPGKVVHFKQTKGGGANEFYLRLRRQLGATLPARVAYDLRVNDWPVEAGISNMTAGNFIHGSLNTWLLLGGESKALYLLAYDGNTFYRSSGNTLGYKAPAGHWEHYEVVVVPGDPAHFELWIGVPPVKIAEDTATLPEAGTRSPTYVEIGFTRSNVGPMPAIEAYYDNVVVTSVP
jgi:hypothetical protein